MQLTITLNEIKKHNPCGKLDYHNHGYNKGLSLIRKRGLNLDSKFTLIDILNSNGIEDAIWCLRCFNYLDVCLFLADLAESVLYIYENKYKSPAPLNTIQGIRDYKAGKITKNKLKILSNTAINANYAAIAANYTTAAANYTTAANYAAIAANYTTADAAAAANYAAIAANYAAIAAATDTDNYTAIAANYTADAAANYAAADNYTAIAAIAANYAAIAAADNYANARKNKWKEIEKLFIKHFGE